MPRARILGLVALLAIPCGAAASRASTSPQIVVSADQAPQSSYEVYRLDPNGRLVNLSRSPADDLNPLVSPDGKEVAFFSYRGLVPGRAARIYEVRIDGTNLRSMAPALSGEDEAGSLAWQPHGNRLAAISAHNYRYQRPSRLWILRPGHGPKQVLSRGVVEPSWSPDGRVLLALSGHAWRAISPSGRHLWARGSKNEPVCCGTSWSTHDLLAITTRQQLRVYDEPGAKRFAGRVPTGPVSAPAWSPNGREVALVAGGVVEVRTARGRLVRRKQMPSLDPRKPNILVWADDQRVVAGLPGTGRQEGVVVRTGQLWDASGPRLDPRSADGRVAIVTSQDGANLQIGVEPVGGGAIKPYGTVRACGQTGPLLTSLQFAGRSRSIVYESACSEPNADVRR